MRRLVPLLLLSGFAALASSCSEAQATVTPTGNPNCGGGRACYSSSFVASTNGSSSEPAFRFSSASNTGIVRESNGTLSFVVSGTERLNVGSTGVAAAGYGIAGVTSALAGSVNINGEYRSGQGNGSNAVGLTTNGARVDLGTGSNDYLKSDGTRIETPGSLQFIGVDTASLGSASDHEGALQYDTDDNRLKTSDGTAWGVVALAEEIHGYSNINVEEQPFAVKNAAHPGKVYEGDAQGVYGGLRFVVTTAGSGAGSAVLKLTGSGGTTCTVSFACDLVAGSVVGDDETIACSSSDTAVVTADTDVLLSWNSTSNCTTLPSGNASATWR